MGAKKNSESEVNVNKRRKRWKEEEQNRVLRDLEWRIIALERGLEGVLRRLEESGQPDDAPGWYGRPE